jgi:hypothetical protein
MASNFFKDIGDELANFVDWVKDALEDEAIRKAIAEDLGLEPGQSIQKPPAQQLNSVDTYRSKANPDKEAFVALLNDVRAFYQNIRNAISGFGNTDTTRINSIVYLIFDMLALNYARLYFPRAYALVQALSAMVEDSSAMDDNPYAVERFFAAIGRAEEFALSPIGYTFRSLQIGVEDEQRARKVSDRIFPQIATFALLAKSFHEILEPVTTKEVIYGWDSLIKPDNDDGPNTRQADIISERMLSIAYPFSQEPTDTADLSEALGLTMAIVPKTHSNKPGLQIGINGTGEVEYPISEKWKVALRASATPAVSFLIKAEDWNFDFGAQTPTDTPLSVALMSIPDETDVSFALPDSNETRIEIGQLAFSFFFDGTSGGIKAQALRCALVIAAKDQDGFLAKILPKDGLRIPFNFGVGFSTDKKFFTEGNIDWPTGQASLPVRSLQPASHESIPVSSNGSSRSALMATREANTGSGSPSIPNLSGASKPELGLQTIIAIGKALLAVRLDHLFLGLSPSPDPEKPEAKTEVSLSLAVKLGPVTVAVERIGFELGLSFPESGGNVGFADLQMGFKAPTGAGIKIDSPYVSGGGFLSIDRDKGQYAGFVQLTVQNRLTLTGVGVLMTRLPNGEKGFSFVVIITAQGFKPIPLGLGFTLTGIGGLLAINRTCNEEFLREGIKNKTLDHLLFPKDPIGNAVQIFGTLNKAFPTQPGSYLFGPVLQIKWRSIITMDLGLILELGNRKRLIILGRISVIMPNEKTDLIRLQMNALGVIDFDQGSISLDAVLYDSRLAGKFPITGSMAMRLNWGSAPQFALSIGGFHPAFKPPANFPALERLAITFSNTANYRLRAECYLAVTSNTLQFGARLDLFVRVAGFSIEGALGLDVLIQFSPFGFIANFLVSVQIKRGSHNLFKLRLEGELTGPRPLHIKGKVTFEILWLDVTIPIDKTLIEGERPPALAPVAVMSQLVMALQDSRNWSGQLAENDRRMVTLRELAAPDQIALHPIGRLSVKQDVVPLDLEISRFGDSTPADGRLFKINSFSVNGNNVAFERVKDFFAPSQFLDLSDDEKLKAPSFEPMVAGVSAGADSFLFTSNDIDLLEDETLAFETVVIDRENNESRATSSAPVTPEILSRQILLGAAARSDIRRAGAERYKRSGAKNTIAVKGWSIASTVDGSAQAGPGVEAGEVVSYSESFQALQKLKQQNPNKAKSLMLVRVNNE